MRSVLAIALILFSSGVGGRAAEHAWRAGTWVSRTEAGVCTIETARDIITAELSARDAAMTLAPGAPVQVAVERTSVFVMDADRHELALTLRETASKYSTNYRAVGGGHLVKSVAPGGTAVVLEDNSRWEIDPRRAFAVAGWQPDDLISVRREPSERDFAFTLDNTTKDDGALANYRVR